MNLRKKMTLKALKSLIKNEQGKAKSPICVGCQRFELFGTKCRYYWENKKECSMFGTLGYEKYKKA